MGAELYFLLIVKIRAEALTTGTLHSQKEVGKRHLCRMQKPLYMSRKHLSELGNLLRDISVPIEQLVLC